MSEAPPARSLALVALGAMHGRAVLSRRVAVLSARIAPLLPPGRLLDVGCGDGTLAKVLAALRPDVTPEGFDVLVRPAPLIPVTRFDGRTLPVADGAADAALLVDVLHHADDPEALLRECARVAPVVVVKDHLSSSRLDEKLLAFMDWVGNRPHGVVLPYTYFSPASWRDACAAAGLRESTRDDVPDLYPFPFSLVFGRKLHFIAGLERVS